MKGETYRIGCNSSFSKTHSHSWIPYQHQKEDHQSRKRPEKRMMMFLRENVRAFGFCPFFSVVSLVYFCSLVSSIMYHVAHT